MAVLTSGRNAAEFILSEAPGNYSREGGNVAAGQTLVPGEVVSLDGDGRLVAYDGGTDDDAAGVVIYGADATDGIVYNIAYIARNAELNVHCVTYPSGQLVATRAALLEKGIILR